MPATSITSLTANGSPYKGNPRPFRSSSAARDSASESGVLVIQTWSNRSRRRYTALMTSVGFRELEAYNFFRVARSSAPVSADHCMAVFPPNFLGASRRIYPPPTCGTLAGSVASPDKDRRSTVHREAGVAEQRRTRFHSGFESPGTRRLRPFSNSHSPRWFERRQFVIEPLGED